METKNTRDKEIRQLRFNCRIAGDKIAYDKIGIQSCFGHSAAGKAEHGYKDLSGKGEN